MAEQLVQRVHEQEAYARARVHHEAALAAHAENVAEIERQHAAAQAAREVHHAELRASLGEEYDAAAHAPAPIPAPNYPPEPQFVAPPPVSYRLVPVGGEAPVQLGTRGGVVVALPGMLQAYRTGDASGVPEFLVHPDDVGIHYAAPLKD